MANTIWDTVLPLLTPNTDAIDKVITHGDYRVLAYFSSHNANSWKASTNANLTVPTGKKFVVISVWTSPSETDGARDARLFNTTDSTEVLRKNNGAHSARFRWSGDLSNPSQFSEVEAGKTIRLEIWNTDGNKRAQAIVVVGRLDSTVATNRRRRLLCGGVA